MRSPTMKKLSTLLFVLCLSLPGFALANHDGMGKHCERHTAKSFEDADKDHDGTLDREEAKAVCKMDFDKMDTDHDGTLTKDEFKACGRKQHNEHDALHEKRSKQFAAADTDNDGTLTKDEARKLPRVYKNFDAIDVDHDGTVDRDEVHNYMQSHKKK
jgi:Ca2+-binding EF-hand superfamily protein